MLRVLLQILLVVPAAAKDDCVPPAFYTSLPRDRDYYYGVARDGDTDKARDQAIRNLAKQVTGDVEGWDQKKIDDVAPCRDKWEVAASVGKLLPASALLSGWEQDAFERCGPYSYVLVRVDKDRVEKFVRGSGKFKKDVAAALSARLDKVESDVAALTARIERLERGLVAMPPEAKTSDAAKSIAAARADLTAGKPGAEIEKTLAKAEDEYSKLEERLKGYQSGHDAAETARLKALRDSKAPELKAKLAAVDSGKWGFPEAAGIMGTYNDEKDFERMRAFARKLLARKDASKLDGHEDWAAYMALVADMSLKDDKAVMANGESFLKDYPKSDLFSAVKAELDGAIMMARMPKNAAPAPVPVAAIDPCAIR